jgi:glyoxylase-like metal-dependent hydrolase (beta-lactamase superfamily II)
VVTSPGNAAFFREATAARRTLAGAAVAPEGPAEVVLVEDGELALGDGRTLRVLDVGPTEHAAEMLVAWLPESGILFQGDLIRFPDEGPLEPARVHARRLLDYLEARSLEPRVVAGVHGRPGTLEELRRAVAASEAGAEDGD